MSLRATRSTSLSLEWVHRDCALCFISCASPMCKALQSATSTRAASNYPQWGDHEFCNSVRKLIGVDSGWDWLSPNQPIQLTHTLRHQRRGRPRACPEDRGGYYATQKRSGQYQGCAAYNDFRELLEKEKDVDAVVVCTTDHLHAAVSAAAMKKRKHVFCQKPLTHTIYESRRIAEIARETGVATQIAVANQASEDTRLLCEWIWDGAIGPVREVHQLVQPAVLAAGGRASQRDGAGPRRSRLGSVARPGSGASLQSCILALRLARVDRLRLRLARRYGLLQL